MLDFHLCGTIDFDESLRLQRRLVFEERGRSDRGIVLLCEHPPLITVGRSGSRGHIRLSGEQLRRRGLDVRWVRRGGGCVVHGPGQLGVYCIVWLEGIGWSIRSLLTYLTSAVLETLHRHGIRGQTSSRSGGVWGRSGLLAAMGAAVSDGMSFHGAFLNVHPATHVATHVDSVAPESCDRPLKPTMGSLLSERRHGVRMGSVRSTLVEQVANALQCEDYHLHTGHPYLFPRKDDDTRESIQRAG